MRRRRKTKILATLGPASNNPAMMRTLFEAGADVFRINMSHTPHAMLKEMHGHIRQLSESVGHHIGILCDLQGPKIRLGTVPNGSRMLLQDERIRLVLGETADDESHIPIPHPEIFQAIKQKHALLIDDGKVRLRLLRRGDDFAEASVEVPGEIKNRKGVNMPDTLLPMSAMTPKDRSDLEAALALGVDWIALSFVQRPEDVIELNEIVQGRAAVLAKIEKPKALETLDEILAHVDALMVARGDLGVEMPLEAVPGLQKRILRAARKVGKPVVVATQMLESMISSPVPTRAEVSDVAQAVYEGADAVMLSAESASGAYPEAAVAMMDRIASNAECDPLYRQIIEGQRSAPERTIPDALMAAVHEITETIEARAILCWSASGRTTLRAARERPRVPIIAASPSIETARRMALVWGTHAVVTPDINSVDEMVDQAIAIATREGFAAEGETIVITAGIPFGRSGGTNMLRVARVPEKQA